MRQQPAFGSADCLSDEGKDIKNSIFDKTVKGKKTSLQDYLPSLSREGCPLSFERALLTSPGLFGWFGMHLPFCCQLLENWEGCFNKHKIQLLMVRDVSDLILHEGGERYCAVIFFSWNGKQTLSLP